MKEGDVIAGRFRLERRAGAGGMGTVFQALDEASGARVAIKTWSEGTAEPARTFVTPREERALARFEREADALATVSDAAIVRYIEHGTTESAEPYLVMQWVEGQDLASRLLGDGLSMSDTLRLALRLVPALRALHAHGIVHRDVKPANVMLEHGDVRSAVLVDLGVARRAELASATVSGARVGTPSYMAPEQIRDPRSVDGRADVFSLGCILFECLSGRRAFDAEDALGAIAKILLERAPSLTSARPEVPAPLGELIATLVHRERDLRPFADEALERALGAALASSEAFDLPAPTRSSRGTFVTSTEVFGTRGEAVSPSSAPYSQRVNRASTPPVPPLVGRGREFGELSSLLRSGARCVGLWGAAGIGKTRLALELLREQNPSDEERWFIELGRARSADDALRVIAQRAGARVQGDEAVAGALARAFAREGSLLLILDAADVLKSELGSLFDAWSRAAPRARFITTSRERLQVRGGFGLEVGPLTTLAERDLTPYTQVELSAAAQLFVERAREHAALEIESALERQRVERIALALEGVPLAIELAAARAATLGIEQLLTQLARAGGATMHEAIHASVELLSPRQRDVLFACAVFAGAFDAQAAEAVVEPAKGPSVVDILASLREKSLLAASDSRLFLYAPLRNYAQKELTASGSEASVRARHAAYQSTRARALTRLRALEGSRKALELIEVEADDLLSAIEYALTREPPDLELGFSAIVALEPLIVARGPLPVFIDLLTRALARGQSSRPHAAPELCAPVLHMRARLLVTRGEFEAARVDLTEARALAELGPDPALLGASWLEFGVLQHFQRALPEARACYERALELLGNRQHPSIRGRCYGNLGAVLHDQGKLTEAAAHYWKAIRELEETGETRELGNFLSNLALVEQELGARDNARKHYEHAISLQTELGETRLRAIALGNLGSLEAECGDFASARRCHEQALELLEPLGDSYSEALCRARLGAALSMLGSVGEANEQLARARRLLSDADGARFAAVRLQRAFLDLRLSNDALAAGDLTEATRRLTLAESLREEISNSEVHGQPLPSVSDDVRATLRTLTPLFRALRQRLAASPPPEA